MSWHEISEFVWVFTLVQTPCCLFPQQKLWEETKLVNEVFLSDCTRTFMKSKDGYSQMITGTCPSQLKHNAIHAFISHYEQSKMGLNYYWRPQSSNITSDITCFALLCYSLRTSTHTHPLQLSCSRFSALWCDSVTMPSVVNEQFTALVTPSWVSATEIMLPLRTGQWHLHLKIL